MLTVNHLVTSGTFSLDGGTWDVDNNVWVLGDNAECVVIDAPHDADAILSAVGPRRLTAILCTHAHDDHVDAAAALAEATRAPIWLHPADRELWDQTYPDRAPDRSEEHTSELQSRLHLVCRLLLEKKKKKQKAVHISHTTKRAINV